MIVWIMEKIESEVNEKLRIVHEVLEGKSLMLEREHHLVLETLYQVVPDLDFIPKRLWIRVNEMLKLKVIHKGKKLIHRSVISPPCYIILTGGFEVIYKNQEQTPKLAPGSICGDYYILNGKRWRPANVVAIEESSVAEFSANTLHQLILEENSNQQFRALISFLKDTIPEYELLSRHSQERLAQFFKERTFYPGQLLINEGAMASSAYLISEGVCDVVSFNTPLIPSKLYQPTRTTLRVERVRRSVSQKMNGYMCRSTTMYQFNSAATKNWVGDDIILGIEKYQYSVIARTKVVALEIVKDNLKKLTPKMMENLQYNAKVKMTIQSVRKSKLEMNLTRIYNMNPKFISDEGERCKARNIKSEQRTNRTKTNKSFYTQSSTTTRCNDSFTAFKPQKRILKAASLFNTRRQQLIPVYYHRPVMTEHKKHL
jgi:CRP-like cAMP-binding protein